MPPPPTLRIFVQSPPARSLFQSGEVGGPGKQTVVIKVSMDGHKSFLGELDGEKVRYKALKIAACVSGVVSASLKGDNKDQIEVKGERIDTVKLTKLLRKKVGHADIHN
ncbi:hypothetical protein I3843_10G022100 [Carya illinoinensis]|nr:heavy metal-associated isoprenylated plant protein 46-like isoform X3 [Carya illinoinensis]KAG6690580.1 hypothetical protein I3842_10G022300 [Carya illinoinensis]KAG7958464.1 hypothetical protein I3843_10G022100 [Carya illinoinensis]